VQASPPSEEVILSGYQLKDCDNQIMSGEKRFPASYILLSGITFIGSDCISITINLLPVPPGTSG